jgi:hypothetical protein
VWLVGKSCSTHPQGSPSGIRYFVGLSKNMFKYASVIKAHRVTSHGPNARAGPEDFRANGELRQRSLRSVRCSARIRALHPSRDQGRMVLSEMSRLCSVALVRRTGTQGSNLIEPFINPFDMFDSQLESRA